MERTPERHQFVSDNLGLPGFPVGTEPSSDMGDHVMGVVVIAWLTRHPMDRWGLDWAESGSIEARFRAHLTSGRRLTTTVVGDANSMELSITDSANTLYATAHTTGPDPSHRRPAARPSVTASSTGRARPVHDELVDRVFAPLSFDFDARRDLAFTERSSDGEVWRRQGWAHPAWLASASNAIVRRNVDFGADGRWTNAGLAVRHHRPIPDGSSITLTGGIHELFDRGRHRFAVARTTAWVAGDQVAELGNTFVYETRA